MTRCKIQKLCQSKKLDIKIYDPKSKKIIPRSNKKKNVCSDFQKI